MNRNCLALACSLLFLTIIGCGSKKYEIKTKESQEGDKQHVDHHSSFTLEMKLVAPNGESKSLKKITTNEAFVYNSDILKMEGGKRSSFRRQYEKAEQVTSDKSLTLPYQGKTVLIDKEDGKFRFRIEGGPELVGDDAARLQQELGSDLEEPRKLLLPPGSVRVGDTWNLPMDKLTANYEKTTPVKLDASTATGTGKFTSAYMQDGKQFGILEYKMEMPIVGKIYDVLAAPGSKLTLDQKLEGCIDGSFDTMNFFSQMKLDVNGMVSVPEVGNVKIVVEGRGTYVTNAKELPK